MKTLGIYEHCHGLFAKLGVALTRDTLHCLTVKSNVRHRRIAKTKTNEHKKKRKKDEHRRLKDDANEAKKARAKREGSVCKPGIGMTGGYDANELEEKNDDDNPTDPAKVCSSCGEPGHLRPWNKKCKNYVARAKKNKPSTDDKKHEPVVMDEEAAMAEEMNAMDILPLQDEDSTDTAFFSAESGGFDRSDSDTDVMSGGFLQCGASAQNKVELAVAVC